MHEFAALRYLQCVTHDFPRRPDPNRLALDGGAHIHTDTSFVANEVSDSFGVPFDEITRIPPGVDAPTAGDPAAGHALAGTTRYVLALGTVEPRKNLPVLVEAFDQLAEDDPDVRLVIAGRFPEGRPAGRGDGVRVPIGVRGIRLPATRGNATRNPRGGR